MSQETEAVLAKGAGQMKMARIQVVASLEQRWSLWDLGDDKLLSARQGRVLFGFVCLTHSKRIGIVNVSQDHRFVLLHLEACPGNSASLSGPTV